MLITRTPLRIPLAGGGTDLPVWYSQHGSMFISAAIDKYVWITYHRSQYDQKIRVRYSKMEEVDSIEQVQNEIFRESLRFASPGGLEITSHAEIPAGTGLGSSGSFGVGLLHALTGLGPEQLAHTATQIQWNLGYPIGWQDQVIAAAGGIQEVHITKDGSVSCKPLNVNAQELQSRLALFYTGIKRDTNEVLRKSTTDGLELVQDLAWQAKDALEKGQWNRYGDLLNEHWEAKKKRGGMTNPQIDEWVNLGLDNGARGAKVLGAGGGGFIMFYTEDKERLIKAMPLMYQPFAFDHEGSKMMYGNQNIR